MNPDAESAPGWERAALAAVLIAGSVVRLYFAQVWHLAYDEAWNLFYSVVQPWDAAWAELKHHAHPPISVAWIWLMLRFGEPPFWARMGSIVPGVAIVALAYRWARQLGLTRQIPLLVALLLAHSPVWINLSVCVRSYTLMSALLAVAALAFSEIVRAPDQVSGRRVGVFVLASLLAMWTEYPAGFATLAMLLSLPVLAIGGMVPWRGLRRLLQRQWPWWLVLAAGSAGLAMYFTSVNMPIWQGHAAEFYRAEGEGFLPYAWRGLGGVAERLTFLSGMGSSPAAFVLVLGLAGLTALEVRRGRDPARAATVVTTILLLGGLAVLGATGLYPFGGWMRHQAVLFPFLVLLLGQGLDRLVRVRAMHRFAVTTCVCAVAATAVFCFRGLGEPPLEEFPDDNLFAAEFAALQPHLDEGRPLYLTHFTHFGFFANTMTRGWRCIARPEAGVFVYAVTDGRREQRVIVDRSAWLPEWPPADAAAQRLSALMREVGLDELIVVSWRDGDAAGPPGAIRGPDASAVLRAHGLSLEEWFRIGDGYGYRVRRTVGAAR